MAAGAGRAAGPRAIVDAHHHLWDLSAASPVRYAWLQEGYDPAPFLLGEYAPICRDFMPAQLRAAWGDAPLVATVHVEAECNRTHAMAETRWLHEVHRASGMPNAIVAWVDLLADDAPERLAEIAELPLVRGVRFKPQTAASAAQRVDGRPGALDDARWPAALRRLHRHGLVWDLRVPYWHLEQAAALLRAVPELTVVVEHTGLPWDRSEAGLAAWRRGLAALAEGRNVHLKLSELGLRDAPWNATDNLRVVREALAVFGARRCLFGSNFPVASLRVGAAQLVRFMNEALAPLNDAERNAVWHDNAIGVYRIALAKGPTKGPTKGPAKRPARGPAKGPANG